MHKVYSRYLSPADDSITLYSYFFSKIRKSIHIIVFEYGRRSGVAQIALTFDGTIFIYQIKFYRVLVLRPTLLYYLLHFKSLDYMKIFIISSKIWLHYSRIIFFSCCPFLLYREMHLHINKKNRNDDKERETRISRIVITNT